MGPGRLILAGVQKCFALPPGFAVCTVSARAFERAKTIPNRGYYFDFIENEKYAVKYNTPATPGISFLYALDKQMDCMFAEGLENRYARHLAMAQHCRAWAKQHFALFGDEQYAVAHRHAHHQHHRLRLRRAEQGAGQARRADLRRLRPVQGQDLPHRPHGRPDAGRRHSG